MLPRSFDQSHINASTCLSLPFSIIISHSLPETHLAFDTFIIPQQLLQNYPGSKKLITSDIFLFDEELHRLRLRCPTTESSRFRNISRFVITLIRSSKILFEPFFIAQCLPTPSFPPATPFDLSPFSLALRTPLKHTTTINRCSILFFKHIISPVTQPPRILTYSTQWTQFWKLKIPLSSRTIWYRSIHGKLPTRAILHHLIPTKHPSPSCTICSLDTVKTSDHFLFECPSKIPIWTHIISAYISPTGTPTTISAFFHALLSLSLPDNFERYSSLTLCPQLNTYQIFACTLLGIWQAHWRLIFDNTPFVQQNIIISTTKHINKLNSEIQLEE